MKLVKYNDYLVTTVDTDGMVPQQQGINSYSQSIPLAFPVIYGLNSSMYMQSCSVIEFCIYAIVV